MLHLTYAGYGGESDVLTPALKSMATTFFGVLYFNKQAGDELGGGEEKTANFYSLKESTHDLTSAVGPVVVLILSIISLYYKRKHNWMWSYRIHKIANFMGDWFIRPFSQPYKRTLEKLEYPGGSCHLEG